MSHADSPPLLVLLTLDIAIIVGLARLVGRGFARFGQPQVVGEIVAGILLGPSFLGWAMPGVTGWLFPDAVLPLLKALSECGIVFFMFLVGMELDPALLRNFGKAAVAVAASSIVTPFVLGFALAYVIGPALAPAGVAPGVFALFLAAAMSVTAFPVLARILAERGMLRSPLGQITLSCAAANDLFAWVLLALIVSLARANDTRAVLIAFGCAVGFVAFMILVARPGLAKLSLLRRTAPNLTQGQLAAVIAILFLCASVAEWLGIHAILGAFLLGAVLPKDPDFVRDLSEKVEDFAIVFFLPLYFAHSGLRTEVTLLDDPRLWAYAVGIIVIAVAGKFVGSAVAARMMGVELRQSVALGVLMNTRGLMELVLLNVGLDLGVVSPELFAIMVLMALTTTLMAAPGLDWAYPNGFAAEPVPTPSPSIDPEQTVLVPIAFSGSGPHLVRLAAGLALPPQPRVYALHIARPAERGLLGAADVAAEGEREALMPAIEYAAEVGVDLRPVALTSATPGADICEVARAKAAGLIVMGWHKPVFTRSVLGGVVDQVLRGTAAGVAVWIDRGLGDHIENILLPYAGTAHDQYALRLGARLAQATHARVTILHVVRPDDERPSVADAVGRNFDFEAPDPHTGAATRVTVLRSDDPVRTVAEQAARHDLTVLGMSEQWEVEPNPFAWRGERIVEVCPSSLLLVRAPLA